LSVDMWVNRLYCLRYPDYSGCSVCLTPGYGAASPDGASPAGAVRPPSMPLLAPQSSRGAIIQAETIAVLQLPQDVLDIDVYPVLVPPLYGRDKEAVDQHAEMEMIAASHA